MNNKEKQVEEMAQIIEQASKQGFQRIMEETRRFVKENHHYSSRNDYYKAHNQTIYDIEAEALYNAGYRDQKEIARYILRIAIQLSDVCREPYEFQNRLVDLIETIYGIEVERETIIPAEKYGVEVE